MGVRCAREGPANLVHVQAYSRSLCWCLCAGMLAWAAGINNAAFETCADALCVLLQASPSPRSQQAWMLC